MHNSIRIQRLHTETDSFPNSFLYFLGLKPKKMFVKTSK